MGMPDVAELFLSIVIAFMAFMSGRFKSVSMRSGLSVNALLIPWAEFSAHDVLYPASFRQTAIVSARRELSSTISIFAAITVSPNDQFAGHDCRSNGGNFRVNRPLQWHALKVAHEVTYHVVTRIKISNRRVIGHGQYRGGVTRNYYLHVSKKR